MNLILDNSTCSNKHFKIELKELSIYLSMDDKEAITYHFINYWNDLDKQQCFCKVSRQILSISNFFGIFLRTNQKGWDTDKYKNFTLLRDLQILCEFVPNGTPSFSRNPMIQEKINKKQFSFHYGLVMKSDNNVSMTKCLTEYT